jgi:hypothetical protein
LKAGVLGAGLLLIAVPAFAQEPRPLPVVVVEVRGLTGGLAQDPVTLTDLGVDDGSLPDRVFGGVAGLHVYPLRRRGFALGIGGEGLLARGRRAVLDEAGTQTGERIVRQLQGLAGIVSLNFGHANGWSHVSGGIGPLRFKNALVPALPGAQDGAYALTVNGGGGARWFLSRHAAFGFDVRLYFTRAAAGSTGSAGRQAARLVLLSAGITIK